MSKLKGTKTLSNLINAFAGESQARNRYHIYASVAGKEGHNQIADIFNETAENERLHAKTFYEFIIKGLTDLNEHSHLTVKADYPVFLGDTLHNLKAAAAGEHEEFTVLYNAFGAEAEQEGFKDISYIFHKIAEIESDHEKRYLDFAGDLENSSLYKKSKSVIWKCTKCGHKHEGLTTPEICPICKHPKGYFVVEIKNI